MKNLMVSIAFLGMVLTTQAQANVALARVNRVQGKEVYILSQPLRAYRTVAHIKTSLKITSVLTRGIINETINEKANEFTQRAIRKAMKKVNQPFDSILYSGGKTASAIQFTEEATVANLGIGKVSRFWELEVYILAEPLRSYSVNGLTWGGVKGIPLLTYGFVNNSIERDVMKFAKKLKKEDTQAQALIYSAGRKAVSASFK